MESERKDIQNQELDPLMKEYFDQIREIIYKKFEIFQEKLDIKKQEINSSIKLQILEVNKINSEVINLKENLNKKCKLSEETKLLKAQVEDLILKMDNLEVYVNNFKEKPLSEILSIENDDFVISLIPKKDEQNESPANSFKSNSCRQCKSVLAWGNSNNTKKCMQSSTECNSNYRYGCNKCDISYCTKCAYPPDISICGCGNGMNYQTVFSNKCDLCRKRISDTCYRCQVCDFDVCDTCYNKLKKDSKDFKGE